MCILPPVSADLFCGQCTSSPFIVQIAQFSQICFACIVCSVSFVQSLSIFSSQGKLWNVHSSVLGTRQARPCTKNHSRPGHRASQMQNILNFAIKTTQNQQFLMSCHPHYSSANPLGLVWTCKWQTNNKIDTNTRGTIKRSATSNCGVCEFTPWFKSCELTFTNQRGTWIAGGFLCWTLQTVFVWKVWFFRLEHAMHANAGKNKSICNIWINMCAVVTLESYFHLEKKSLCFATCGPGSYPVL